jgi:hypothetical protein
MWNSVPAANDTYSFKWYAGTTNILNLRGDGLLTLGGTLKFADATEQTTAWTGTIDKLIKVAGSFGADQPFKSEVIADATNGVTVKTWEGIPEFATSKTWEFDYDGNLTFPDDTVQTTAWTGILPSPTYSGSDAIGNVTPAALNLNNTGTSGELQTQLTLINTAGGGGTGSAIDFFTYTDAGTGFPGARIQSIDDNNYSANLSIVLKEPGSGDNTAGSTWTFGSDGNLTFPDATEQTTAWTGSVDYADVTDTPTIYTSAYIGTTNLAFNRSSASQTLNGVSIDGNAATATSAGTLTTSRNINGVGFNGSSNINVPSITDGTNTLKIVAVPSTLAGAAGDVKGNVAFDENYAYYCRTSYGGSNYTVTAASGTTGPTMTIRKGSYPTPQAGWTVTFGTPVVITSVVDAGVVYGYDSWTLNFGSTVSTTGGNPYTLTDTSSTIWVRTPWDSVANTITYTPSTAVGAALTTTGKDTQGGTGYFDFLRATNTTSGVANGNKTFRLNSTGGIEIINSAYSATIFSLSDAGALNASSSISVGGKQAVNGPAFRAYVDSGQTISTDSQQKVTFGTETFDTNGNFASSRFTPTVEGYYQLNATVRLSGNSGTGECMIILYKNGSEYARGTNESGTEQGSNFWSMQVSDIAYANGSSDYFEIYIQQGSATNRTTTAGQTISYFSGSMIRGA